MSTTFQYTAKANISEIIKVFDSVGAHIGSKLQNFSSDERTLTDEICDMSAIWLNTLASTRIPVSFSTLNNDFQMTFSKTTAKEEKKIGADLKLTIQTPEGYKNAIFQSKVLEPKTQKFRFDNRNGWRRLREQLIKMNNLVGDTAYLLLYVPGEELNGKKHYFSTWEQSLKLSPKSNKDSSFGTTVIPFTDLIDKRKWKSKNKIIYSGKGNFRPLGMTFTYCLLELLCCQRGKYNEPFYNENNSINFYRTLTINIEEIETGTWTKTMQEINNFLRNRG